MPEAVEAKEIHFLDGLVGRPAVVRHTIGGDENAGAIIAEAAVNEDFFIVILEEGKKLRDLFVGGRRPAAYGNVDEAHAEGFGLLAFTLNLLTTFAAKIDDGGDAEFLEPRDAFGMRLRATKERIVDFSGIVNTRELKLFAEGNGGDGGRRIILRRRKRGKDEEQTKEKKRARRKKFHRRLDAKSLARETGGRNLKTRRWCEEKRHH